MSALYVNFIRKRAEWFSENDLIDENLYWVTCYKFVVLWWFNPSVNFLECNRMD